MLAFLALAAALGLAPDLAAAAPVQWTARCAAALRAVASSEGIAGTVHVTPAAPGALPSVRFVTDEALARLDLEHPRQLVVLDVLLAESDDLSKGPSRWAPGWGGVHGELRTRERRFPRHHALMTWPRAPGYVDFGPRGGPWMRAVDRCLAATPD